MKKFQVLLYVASIAVAIGLGMTQVGKVGENFKYQGADAPPCETRISTNTCSGVNAACKQSEYHYEGSGTKNARDVTYTSGEFQCTTYNQCTRPAKFTWKSYCR